MEFTLQLLHASDLEGGVEAIERAPNFTAIANAFQDALPNNTITLSAGDNYISGPFFSAAGDQSAEAGIEAALAQAYEFLFGLEPGTLLPVGADAPPEIETDNGRVDIAIANLVGFDASVLGNHEFDLGTFEVADIIGTEVAGGFSENGILAELENPGALFPYLAANLDFSNDINLPFLFTEELLTTDDFDLTQAIEDFDAEVAAAIAAGGSEADFRPAEGEGNDDFIDFDRIAPSVITEVDGEQVGIIGLATPDLASLTSLGGVEVIGPDGDPNDQAVLESLAEIANAQVDALQAQGVNKIILASHLQQFSFEQALAPLVEGVDIFLAGGSDFILLDENDPPFGADEAGDTYPVLTQNADGDPAVLLSTNGEYTYVGRLLVDFTEDGILIPESILVEESGAFRTTDQGVLDVVDLLGITPEEADITNFADLDLDAIAADAANAIGSIEYDIAGEAGLVQDLTGTVEAVVESQDGNVAGFTDVFLDGIRANVRTQETNLGNLSADANLFYAQQIDPTVTVSLQNAGGIRVQVGDVVVDQDTDETSFLPPQENEFRPEGAVSQLAISDVFRFDNSLTLQTITQEQLIVQLENGVENAVPTLDNEPGQFPQIAGVAFSFDPNLPAFNPDAPEGTGRILSAALDDGTVLVENGEFVGDPDAPVRVVINEFLAGLLGDNPAGDTPDGYTFEPLALADPDFADVINLEEIDAPADFDEIQFSGATVNGQVDAVAEFLNEFHPTPETAFAVAETDVEDDLRIQNLEFRADTVLGAAVDPEEIFPAVDPVEQPQTEELAFDVVSSIGDAEGVIGAEITAFDPISQSLFITSGDGLQVFDFSDPASPTFAALIDPADFGFNNSEITSVSVSSTGLVAVALPDSTETNNGSVLFLDATGELLGSVEVGPLPDSLAFTPDGSQLVVANEGESNGEENEPSAIDADGNPIEDFINPEGSISVIDVDAADLDASVVTTLGFGGLIGQEQALLDQGVRINPNAENAAVDLEPEFVAISPDGTQAFVTLQENNAVAVVDLENLEDFTLDDIQSLGVVDYAGLGQLLDASDEDDGINLRSLPVFGLRQADAIASFVFEGDTFYVTANEGDGRDVDVTRIADLELDPNFPDAEALQDNTIGGRLEASNVDGDTDGDGDIDEINVFGGRSFSIFDDDGNLVFDSGDLFEQVTALEVPEIFNADDEPDEGETQADTFDTRSDDSGPEPEGVVVAQVRDRNYAFVGLERVGGIAAFDITNPFDVNFVDYIPGGSDLSPEGLLVIAAEDNATGSDLLVVTNEVSNTVTTFALTPQVFEINTPDGDPEVGGFFISNGLAFEILNFDNPEPVLAEDIAEQTDADFDNIVGFYQVTDLDGGIDTDGDGIADILPNADGSYAEAAIEALIDPDDFVLRGGSVENTTAEEFAAAVADDTIDIINAGGDFFAPVLLANGGALGFGGFFAQEAGEDSTFNNAAEFVEDVVAYFSFVGANPDGEAHIQALGNNTFGFEDLPGNLGVSDQDFNDLVFNVEFA